MRTRQFTLLVALLGLPLAASGAQESPATRAGIAAQRRDYETIRREFPTYRSISFDLNRVNVDGNGPDEGGDVVGYCKGDSVRLIVLYYNTERSSGVRRFYVMRDSIFYLLDGSDEGGPYTRLYFDGPRLVRWYDEHGRSKPVDGKGDWLVASYPEFGYSLLKAMHGCVVPPRTDGDSNSARR